MKALITIVVLALIAWGIYAWIDKDNVEAPTNTETSAQTGDVSTSPATQTDTVSVTATTTVIPEVKELTVVGKSFSFSPSTIMVNKGDRVRVTFKNEGGQHDWVIDEFNARTNILSSEQSQTIEFVADKAGSFEYYCSVGTHRQMGMKGTLVVK